MFNVESRLICGKFLNIRVYIPSNGLEPFPTVLRKENNKYNITPPTSNVSKKYKNMAGLGYFRTARMLCSSPEELRNQYRTIQHILRLKGFSKQLINEIQTTKIISDKKPLKRFISTVIFDEISQQHRFLQNLFKHSKINLDNYYLPTDVPGTKLEQHIFTVKKMRAKLNF